MKPRLVHLGMAARELGVTKETARAWCKAGKLVYVRGVGKLARYFVTRESLDALLKGERPPLAIEERPQVSRASAARQSKRTS